MNYFDLIEFKKKHEDTPRDIISYNILKQLRIKKIKVYQLAEILDISKHTAYAYTKKKGYTLKPDMFIVLVLATYLNIDQFKLFKSPNET